MDKVALWTKAGRWCKGVLAFAFVLEFMLFQDDPNRLMFLEVFDIVAVVLALSALFYAPPFGEKELNTTGVYKYTRHPLYLALLMVNLSYWLRVEVWTSPLFLLLEVVFCVSLAAAIHCQERETCERFGEAGVEYHKRTPRFPSYSMIKKDLKEPRTRLTSKARKLRERQRQMPSYSSVKARASQGFKSKLDLFVAKVKETIAALRER